MSKVKIKRDDDVEFTTASAHTAFIRAMGETLDLYNKDVRNALNKCTAFAANRLVEEATATAPVYSGPERKNPKYPPGSFAASFAKRKMQVYLGTDASYLVYNRSPHYRITHLVEHGFYHAAGRWVDGTHFLRKATARVEEEYTRKVVEVIKDLSV